MMWKLYFLILNIALAAGSLNNRRSRRYIIYPDGGPARTQFIIGLGIPVDLKEQSVTVGAVMKFQYDLPTNSTEYTSRIYGFANTVSRDMDGDDEIEEQKTDESERKITNDEEAEKSAKEENDVEKVDEEDENALVDITFERRKRALLYSEGGVLLQNGITQTELPLDEAIKRQEMIDKKYQEQDMPPNRANRWDFYKILEHMATRYGYTGRPCLLRTICEAAEVPFTHDNGLLGEIGHILFTPSTTKDKLSHHTDNEYHAAEKLGKDQGTDCERLFPECEGSVLDTFTEIGMDTLHKFGLA